MNRCRIRVSLAISFETVYNNRVTAQLNMRSREEITRLCDGFTLLDPGLVWIPQWLPDAPDDVPEDPSRYWALVGVARYDGPPTPSATAD
jgi:S-adenosyl methyltransferase